LVRLALRCYEVSSFPRCTQRLIEAAHEVNSKLKAPVSFQRREVPSLKETSVNLEDWSCETYGPKDAFSLGRRHRTLRPSVRCEMHMFQATEKSRPEKADSVVR
jgi:hypothetical protein